MNLVARFFPIKIPLEFHSLAKIVAGEVSLEAANIYASDSPPAIKMYFTRINVFLHISRIKIIPPRSVVIRDVPPGSLHRGNRWNRISSAGINFSSTREKTREDAGVFHRWETRSTTRDG